MASIKHKENIVIERDNSKMSKDFARQFNKLKRGAIVFCQSKNNINDSLSYATVTGVISSDQFAPDYVEHVCFDVSVEDGNKCGSLLFYDGPPTFPKTIYGYWLGKGDWVPTDKNKKYYEFVCLDPELIPYLTPS